MKQETIKIRYFPGAAQPLDYIDGKSDWIDLRAAERVELKAGQFRLIRLGVAMALPAGYEAHVVPRSSTFKTWGILQTNSMGVIDGSYCGDNDEWRMPVYATRTPVSSRATASASSASWKTSRRSSLNRWSTWRAPTAAASAARVQNERAQRRS